MTDLLSRSELAVWKGFLRTHATLVRSLDAELEAAHGLPLTSYEVLMQLADAPGGRMRMHEIAASVLLSRSGLTRLVDRLVARGCVVRAAATEDGRGAVAELTAEGRALVGAARATHLEGVRRRFLRRLTDQECTDLSRLWIKLELN